MDVGVSVVISVVIIVGECLTPWLRFCSRRSDFANVSRFGVVVGLVDRLGGGYFTEARASKWAK